MALRDLLVHVDQTPSALVRLRLAADLAVRHGSFLTALYVREWSRAQLDARKSAELGLASLQGLRDLDRQTEDAIDATADKLRGALAALRRDRGLQAELRVIDGEAAAAVPQYARYADLCVLAPDQPEGPASVNYTFAEHLLFATGRPVLFIPDDKPPPTLGRHVVVAWNSSRPAARSVNDALPLLERAERVTVLMVNPSGFIDERIAPPGEQMVEHLRRHGATTTAAVRIDNVPPRAIADTLQEKAADLGGDILVAGAFGHPRLWEKMLGGVTHDLIAGMRLPILMSH